MNEIWIKIFPNDTLFFRTGRPFTMGSETWSDVIFPPYPSTIYGALRTFLLFHRGGNLKNFNYEDIGSRKGDEVKKGSLQLFGPILCEKENTLFFPVPLDLVVKKGADNESLILSKIEKPDIFFSDYELENILFYKKEGQVDNIDGYVNCFILKNYLECK
ncbi:MAG: hypothetical protein N2647_03125, partial [Thermodesulfovibrio sp.]|nr:hypothetical protein [Thermodesulfovibrio sp.]